MADPTPITLPEGEALYRAGDLPDEGWECKRILTDPWWRLPSSYIPDIPVIARRKRWVPKVGDRAVSRHKRAGRGRGEVHAVHEPSGTVWFQVDGDPGPYTIAIADIIPEINQ